jgi:hypothetical protein
MGLFWKRKSGSEFISLGLNTPLEPAVEEKPEPVLKTEAAAVAPAKPVEPFSPEVVAPSVIAPIVVPPSVVSEESEAADEEGFLRRFRRAVASTRENLATRIEDVVKGEKQIDATTLDSLEEVLLVPISACRQPSRSSRTCDVRSADNRSRMSASSRG